MEISLTELAMVTIGAVMGYLMWIIKRYQTKVDDLDTRVTKIETVMQLLGDIKSDLSSVRTDIEVIKVKLATRQ